MNERNPICLQVPVNYKCDYNNPELRVMASETVALEEYGEQCPAGSIIEACSAEWFKKDEFGDMCFVKCLEPADFAVRLKGGAFGSGNYCEMHRPHIVGM